MNNQIKAMQLISQKKKTSHVLHFFISLITIGLWLPVWLIVVLSNSIENARIDSKLSKLQ